MNYTGLIFSETHVYFINERKVTKARKRRLLEPWEAETVFLKTIMAPLKAWLVFISAFGYMIDSI